MASTLPPGELFALDGLVTPTARGIASRVLTQTAAGNVTLFALDADEELSAIRSAASGVSSRRRLTVGHRKGRSKS